MCDGQPADDCDVMNLAEFQNTLKYRLEKLDDQFLAIADVLKAKKEAFAKMYRENPKISHDEAVSLLQLFTEAFNPNNPEEGSALNTMQNQLIKLQEQLAHQQRIAAEAEEARRGAEELIRGAEEKNEELQSVLNIVELEKSNLGEELEEMKKSSLNLKNDIEKLTRDLKAVTVKLRCVSSSKSEVDGNKQNQKSKQTIICDSFSNDNYDATVSSCKRRVEVDDYTYGYCFLDHPRIEKNQVLKWTIRVPKFKDGRIGMVIILDLIIFDL